VARIVDLDDTESRAFWQHADAEARQAELERIRDATETVARQWRAKYEALR
jgi:hypothetical protein